MKVFKLLKWYPTLPKDWKVGLEVIPYKNLNGIEFFPKTDLVTDRAVTFSEVENAEFWKDVTEFEILEYRDIHGAIFYKTIKSIDNNPVFKSTKTSEEVTSDEIQRYVETLFAIHKVRRTSDGEVFKLGDIVVRHKDENCTSPNLTHRKIDKFITAGTTIRFTEGGESVIKYLLTLFSKVKNEASKVTPKQPNTTKEIYITIPELMALNLLKTGEGHDYIMISEVHLKKLLASRK